MWILQFLPDSVILWFTNILLLVGLVLTVLGFFVHRIPLLYQYQLPFKIGGIIILALGIYLRGGYGVEMTWRERVAELEQKLDQAKIKSQAASAQIQERVIYRDRVIKEQGKNLIEYVDREVVKHIPAQCEILPQDLIEVHNQAARMDRVTKENK